MSKPRDPLTDEEMRRWAAVILLGACLELGDHAGQAPASELYEFFHSDWAEWLLSVLPGMPSGESMWAMLIDARARSYKHRGRIDRLRQVVRVLEVGTVEDAYELRGNRRRKDARALTQKVV